MEIPLLQSQHATPPEHSIYVNFSPVLSLASALGSDAPLDLAYVFARFSAYFDRFNVHRATFAYMTAPRFLHEVHVTLNCSIPNVADTAQGVTADNAWVPTSDDFKRSVSWVFASRVVAGLANPFAEDCLADAIAHEGIHNIVGPRHQDDPTQPRPTALPGGWWLMDPINHVGPKLLDNTTISLLTQVVGLAQG